MDYAVTTDPHGEVMVQLYWQARQPLTQDYRFYLAYEDRAGKVRHDSQFYQPVAVLWYPTSMWQPGETVLVQSLPWALDHENFALTLGVYQGEDGWSTGQRLPVMTAPIAAMPTFEQQTVVRLGGYRWHGTAWTAVTPDTAEPAQPLAITVGDQLFGLAGVSVRQQPTHAGEALTFTLYWQAGAMAPPFDYALSAQAFDGVGNKVAQLDWQPSDPLGLRPMTSWLPGERIQDTQRLVLPATLSAGAYRLLLSIYNWQTGERLPVVGEATAAGDTIVIATVNLK